MLLLKKQLQKLDLLVEEHYWLKLILNRLLGFYQVLQQLSLGLFFDGFYFYDKCLPMGGALSCSYFETFSTFLHWIIATESGWEGTVHNLDDFFHLLALVNPVFV